MRELFIEELAEVRGGADPIGGILDKLDWVREKLVTTTACGEEIPNPFC
jgi:hypothetical protein